MSENEIKTTNELFDGADNMAKFWQRLRGTAKKSELMTELIDLRVLQTSDKLPDSDLVYIKRLIKAVSAEFKCTDSRISAQKVFGERKDAKRAAHDRRKILIGAFLEKLLSEVTETGKPEFLRPWLSKGLDAYLDKPEDRKLFDDLLSKRDELVDKADGLI